MILPDNRHRVFVIVVVLILAGCAQTERVTQPTTPVHSGEASQPGELSPEAQPTAGRVPSWRQSQPYYSPEQARLRITELKAVRRDLLKKYTEKHPQIVRIDAEIKELAALAEKEPATKDKGLQTDWTPRILTGSETHFLPDYSYSGYQWGARLPSIVNHKVFNVTDYGAVPGDNKPDTDAVKATLAEANEHGGPVRIRFTGGHFIIDDIIFIERNNIVISGSDSGEKTTLFFPKPLLEVASLPDSVSNKLDHPEFSKKRGPLNYTSPVSWRGGFIWSRTSNSSEVDLATALSGKRGQRTVKVSTSEGLVPEMTVAIAWCTDGCKKADFLDHIFDHQTVRVGAKTREIRPKGIVRQFVTVDSVNEGSIQLVEPLVHDIDTDWRVQVQLVNFINDIGIESLRLEFPNVPYRGHHQEAGFNGIFLTSTLHSWIRNVEIHNADSAILVKNSKNITISEVRTTGRGGHHSLSASHSSDILFQNFSLLAPSIHGPSFGTGTEKSVFTSGKVRQMPLDQHNGINQQNLYDDVQIRIDNVADLLNYGGADRWLPTAGAFSTLWNVRINMKRSSPLALDNAPSAVIVGMHGNMPIQLDYRPNAWIEGLNNRVISVPSLYRFQYQGRLRRD